MRSLHVTDTSIDLVDIRDPFIQNDFTGCPRELAYCTTLHTYTHINRQEFLKRLPAKPLGISPVSGSGAFFDLGATLEAWLNECETLGKVADLARQDAKNAAIAALSSVPQAARADLSEVNSQAKRQAEMANEGGYGYIPHYGWQSRYGREIAQKHGLDIDALISAERLLEGIR